MKRKTKHFTIAIIPHNLKQGMRFIKIPALLLGQWVVCLLLASGLLSTSIFFNIYLSARLAHYKETFAKVKIKEKKVDAIISEADNIKQAMLNLHLRNNQVRKALGLKPERPSIKLAHLLDKEFLNSLSPEEKRAFKIIKQASLTAQLDSASLKNLKKHVNTVYNKISAMPSKWPVRGPIVSGYGYRVSPWRGVHTGVDIKADYGEVIKATAPGIVDFVGWRSGYGRTVIVKHKYGYQTLYAHCLRLLVKNGQKIDAGQVIARVGVSGYSTGSHLHYEVRKDERSVNPFAYLDLKILTAARIMM